MFDVLTESDVISGLLPRFAIIMPTTKPDRRPFYEVGDTTEQQRTALIDRVNRLHCWATEATRVVRFGPGVLEHLDSFAAALEQATGSRTDTAKAMLHRLIPMVVKLAMLIAAGQPEMPNGSELVVTTADAESAMQIARRWQSYALSFATRVGESNFERKLQRCLRLVRNKRCVARSIVARQAHVDRKTLDNIRDTLVDRAVITIQHVNAGSGPAGEFWHARFEGEEDP